MTTYNEWSKNWITENGCSDMGGYGRCKEASEAMALAFPELSVVRGHVYCAPPWGKRGHWWCVTENGAIVDPTAAQFPEIFQYEEYAEGDPVRLGRCMNCGEEIWGPTDLKGVYSADLCSKECARIMEAYLNDEF